MKDSHAAHPGNAAIHRDMKKRTEGRSILGNVHAHVTHRTVSWRVELSALQMLVFRRDAAMNAEEYCRQSAEELFQQEAEQADDNFWQKPETQVLLDKRKDFIKRVLVQLMKACLTVFYKTLILW